MRERIWLSSPTMHGDEQKYIKQAFDSNWVAPLGKNVDEFENELSDYIGVAAAAAMTAGTHALHIAIKLAGVRRGDIVLCSDLTFAATANPITYEGGIPVFIDSEYDTWNMDPAALEIALNKYGKRVRAVMLAHLYGIPAKLRQITDLCDKYGVMLIEDAAESLSATYRGRQTGSFGKYGILSFIEHKFITARKTA